MDWQAVGRAVERARLRRGWTQDELASAASVSNATISRIENGRQSAGADTLAQVAAALDSTVDGLLASAGHPIILPAAPPLQHVEAALHAGPWSENVKRAIFTLLRETLPADQSPTGA
jgi:transcriptional regulator with XRE-family HTH domain